MISRTSYGGECTVTNATTGDVIGRFWIEIDFRRRPRHLTVAVLIVPEATGVALCELGTLLLHLDDGRQLRGTVSTILKNETIVRLSRED